MSLSGGSPEATCGDCMLGGVGWARSEVQTAKAATPCHCVLVVVPHPKKGNLPTACFQTASDSNIQGTNAAGPLKMLKGWVAACTRAHGVGNMLPPSL